MVQSRKEQLNILKAYWSKTTYTATGDTASTTIAEGTLHSASITGTEGGNASSDPPTRGIVSLGSDNLVKIRNADTGLPFTSSNAVVYGRLTHSGSDYTITYYTTSGGSETETNIPGSGSLNVEMIYPEVMNIDEVPANASLIDEGGFVSGGGSSEAPSQSITLANVLNEDNTTDGYDIVFTDDSKIVGLTELSYDCIQSIAGTVQTTDDTETTLATFEPGEDKAGRIAFIVTAKDGYTNIYSIQQSFETDELGIVTLRGTLLIVAEDEGESSWSVTLDTNNTEIRVRVTGAVSTTINWRAAGQAMVA